MLCLKIPVISAPFTNHTSLSLIEKLCKYVADNNIAQFIQFAVINTFQVITPHTVIHFEYHVAHSVLLGKCDADINLRLKCPLNIRGPPLKSIELLNKYAKLKWKI